MIQLIVGLVLGLVLIAFFVAVMYYVLPDDVVDRALARFRDMFDTLLGNTVGRIIDMIFSPVTAMTSALLGFVMAIGDRAGPLAGFAVALLGVLRTSWGIMAVISPEKAIESSEAMAKATVVLVALMALGAVTWVVYQGLKSLFLVPMALIRAKRRKSRPKVSRGMAVRLGYVLLVVLIVMFGIHVAAEATEIIWPNSDTARILRELDLLEKFYLHVISHVEIR